MKLGLRSGSLSLALLLGIAGAGCGDDDGMVEVDSGTDAGGGVDSGPPPEDTGPVDTGVDAPEPVEQAFVRVAHLSPNTGDVRLCIELRVGGTRVGGLPPLPTDRTIPFRGISPYIGLDIEEGVTYRVKAFVVESIADPVDCTMDSPLFVDVDSADLEVDGYYTGAALGFSDPMPSACGPTFDGPCDAEVHGARLALFEDDGVTDPAAAKVRVLHAIPNAPAIEVCYDPDREAGEEPPMSLFASVAFGEASPYHESATAITTGSFRIFPAAAAAPACTAIPGVRPQIAEITIPDLLEDIRDMFEAGSPGAGANIATTFELDTIRTVFAMGVFPEMAGFVPWRDIPGAPPPEG